MDDFETIFNQYEAGLWFLVSVAIGGQAVAQAFRRVAVPRYQVVAAFAFAVFGVSDVIESHTGAWWTPWWLAVVKVACVGVFAWCYAKYRKARRGLSFPLRSH